MVWPLRCALASLVLLVAAALCLPGLGDRDLASSHEARAGQNGVSILETGCWLLPRLFDEQLELQKPPLYYWLVAVIGWCAGAVDAWVVRLPAALASLGCAALVLGWSWRRGRFAEGVVAAGILTTCCHFTHLARIGRIDMPLTLCVTAALLSFYASSGWFAWWVGCLAVAAGILLKGPIAAALVGIVLMVSRIADPRWCRVGSTAGTDGLGHPSPWRWLGATVLIAALAAPWFVWANYATAGRLWDVFFVYHNFERGFGSATLAAHPPWFYAVRLLVDTLPWSLAVPVAVALAWRRGWWRDDPWCRFGWMWFGAIFILLSLLRFKRADYLLPAYPGLALFLATVAVRWWREQIATWCHWAAPLGFAVVVLVYAAGWGTYLAWEDRSWPYRSAAERIRGQAGVDTPVIFFRAELHPLAFHLGRPLGSVREWENLEVWAREPRPIYFVMPEEYAATWPEHLVSGRLQLVFRLGDWLTGKHDRNLVVLRNVP
ncbi:MAG: glycosyltransferase family 39 protein [Gemmataceae bacterium]|nr:glycosyltransferase family 39 protein [Gemmataceae bacterium]